MLLSYPEAPLSLRLASALLGACSGKQLAGMKNSSPNHGRLGWMEEVLGPSIVLVTLTPNLESVLADRGGSALATQFLI
jgi:hypothetical protein